MILLIESYMYLRKLFQVCAVKFGILWPTLTDEQWDGHLGECNWEASLKRRNRGSDGQLVASSRNSHNRSSERPVACCALSVPSSSRPPLSNSGIRDASRRNGKTASRHVEADRPYNCATARRLRADECRARGQWQPNHRVHLLTSRQRHPTGSLLLLF